MSVVLCDIRGDRLDAALAEVRALGGEAIAVVTDVSDRASVRAAGEAAVRQFGALHVACNNAGITIHGRSVAELTPQEWEWNVGVNFYGVVHGLEVFLPLIRRHGGEGHIVNTASIAGFQIGGHRRSGSDGAMKFAVVALSELITYDLKDLPIGVSVLAPAAVKTRIYTSGENRPARFGGPYRSRATIRSRANLTRGWSRTWWASAWCARSAIASSMCSPTCTPRTGFWRATSGSSRRSTNARSGSRSGNEILLLPPDAVDRPRRGAGAMAGEQCGLRAGAR